MYLGPSGAFEDIAHGPRAWAPLLALVCLNLATTTLWLGKVEPQEFLRAQLEASKRYNDLPAEQQERVLDGYIKSLKPIAWVSALFAGPLIVVVVGGALALVYRFFYATDITTGQAIAIAAWSLFARWLIEGPLSLITCFLKGDWNLNPQEAFNASIAAFLDRTTASPGLYALAASMDLFSLWVVVLLTLGVARATGRKTSSVAWGVVILWLLYVAGKAGLAAAFR